MISRFSLLVFMATALCADVIAEELLPISAERPGFSSSPIALAPSTIQVETGYQYTRDFGTIDIDDHTWPLALIRIGLVDDLELQFSWPGISWQESNGQDVHGVNDVSIGVKWQVNDQSASVPLALFAGLSLPTGDSQFGDDGINPTLGAFWSYNYGVDWFGTALLSHANDELTLGNAVGISLPFDPDTSAYIEYFGIYGARGGPEHYLNGGFAYLPRLDMQLDLYTGFGLNGDAADLFVGFGLAYRF
ncbi:MAG: hypothetical protein GTO41_21190 [Burkholderiales bacterium]|nr:hypothetical protein [Burkholderiales bacterium]